MLGHTFEKTDGIDDPIRMFDLLRYPRQPVAG